MKYRNMPNTTLHPSVLCLGTGGFGTGLDEATSFALLDTFFEHGGNFIDTARVYGAWIPGGLGRSEQVIGKWIKARGMRDKVILGTKGAHPAFTSMQTSRLSHDEIVSDIDDSLRALQTNAIDLYWLHRDDPTRPVAEIIDTLNTQAAQGKLRYFGCSNWRVERIIEAVNYAFSKGIHGFVANQLMWSFALPDPAAVEDKTLALMDVRTMDFQQHVNMAVLAYTSQAHGFLAKWASDPAAVPERYRKIYASEKNIERLHRLQVLSQELSLSIPALSLAYLTSQSVPTYPISGSSNIGQLLENLPAGDIVLSDEQLRYLEHDQQF